MIFVFLTLVETVEIAQEKMVCRISFVIAPLDLLVKDVRARLVSLSKMYLYHYGVNYHLVPVTSIDDKTDWNRANLVQFNQSQE